MGDVFHMSSDGHFVRTWPLSSTDVYVHEYTGNISDPDLIRYEDSGRWRGGGIKIGPSADARFRALEVHGVTIKGSRLTQLYNELTLAASDGQQKLYLAANRNGICYLSVNGPYVTRLRVNDYFGWAKYGVKPQISPSTIWNKCDLSSGAILVDIGQLLKNKEKEMQEMVKEKEKEVLVMRKMVERNKEVESLLEKSMLEKDQQMAVLVEKNKEVESIQAHGCHACLDLRDLKLINHHNIGVWTVN